MPSIGAAFLSRWLVYFGVLLLVVGLSAAGVAGLANWVVGNADDFLLREQGAGLPSSPSHPDATKMRGHVVLTQDWSERIKTPEFWSGRSKSPYSAQVSRSNLAGPTIEDLKPQRREESDDDERRPRVTYRAVCVRLCDGYYWPINFATTPDKFGRARGVCEKSCGSPVKLYVYRNPGGTPEDMRDLDGQPYSKLPAAFLYRSQYNETCRCNPQPWEQEAQDRHRLYALEAARKKGDAVAAKAADELKLRLEQERRGRAKGSAQKAGRKAEAPIIAAAIIGAATVSTVTDVPAVMLPALPAPAVAPNAALAAPAVPAATAVAAPAGGPPPSNPITVAAIPTPAAAQTSADAKPANASDAVAVPPAPPAGAKRAAAAARAPARTRERSGSRAAPPARKDVVATRAALAPIRLSQGGSVDTRSWQARAFREN